MLVILLVAAACMAAQDFLGTFMVIAETRGRSWRAGAYDAVGDVVSRIGTAYGAGTLILHGWSVTAVAVLAVTALTSLFATRSATTWGNRRHEESDDQRRIRELEEAVAELLRSHP